MQQFIKYLEQKNLSKSTQKSYLRHVSLFQNWYQKEVENCSKSDVLKYLEYLKNIKNQANITRKNTLIALNHYFLHLIENERIAENPTSFLKIRGTRRKSLYKTYSLEELDNIYDNYYHVIISNFDDKNISPNQQKPAILSRQRNYMMLGLLVYQGLSTNELQNITLSDLDLNKANIKIKSTSKSNQRTLNLKAAQIGGLMNYVQNIRPQFFEFCAESDKLFLALPESGKSKTKSENLMNIIKSLSKQVNIFDKNFVNFKQIRASVITYWLKTEGLRKAQYYAGHKHISSTESYQPNNLDELSSDITKFNPF
jgi:site-specific recombinase XerD